MQILGVDYGKKRVGLAFADGPLAKPLEVLTVKDQDQAVGVIALLMRDLEPDLVVIGISEGKMAKETRGFGKRLQDELMIPVEYEDETLSTKDADRLAIEAGISRKKRKSLSDAYAAAVILQAYIDKQEK